MGTKKRPPELAALPWGACPEQVKESGPEVRLERTQIHLGQLSLDGTGRKRRQYG